MQRHIEVEDVLSPDPEEGEFGEPEVRVIGQYGLWGSAVLAAKKYVDAGKLAGVLFISDCEGEPPSVMYDGVWKARVQVFNREWDTPTEYEEMEFHSLLASMMDPDLENIAQEPDGAYREICEWHLATTG